jgi:hypothetical protein
VQPSIAVVVALGTLLTLAGPCPAQTQVLRFKQPGAGDTVLVERTENFQSQTRLSEDGKPVVERDEKTTQTFVYRETVVERAEGAARPVRLRRAYEKAQVKNGDRTEDLPYQGKTLLIDKKDKKYRFQIEGGDELKGADARLLDSEFEDDLDVPALCLPAKAVAVDDTWNIDLRPLIKSFEKSSQLQVDAGKAVGTAKLLRVYPKEDVTFAVVEVHLELPFKETSDEKMSVTAGSHWTMDVTIDACLDGSKVNTTTKGMFQMTLHSLLPLPDKKQAHSTATASGSFQRTAREVPPK